MKDAAADDTVLDLLRHAVETDALPKAARGHATHLIQRLSSPVRLTLLGPPGSGKSHLINMFVGRAFLPSDLHLPTLEVTWGETEQIEATLASGEKKTVSGLDFRTVAAMQPAFLRILAPVPILRKVSMLEVVTNGDADEMRSAVDWAVRRTDITLWCSQSFGAGEQTLWSRVPDGLKDHAFLVLTKADILSAKGALSGLIAELETVVSEEFHSLFAVATLQGIKAQSVPGKLDEAMYHGSGGSALTSEILRHAERGRRADLDSAQLFLARYQTRTDGAVTSRMRVEASTQAAEIAGGVPSPANSPEAPLNPEVFIGGARFLKRRGDSLAALLDKIEPGDTRAILDQCTEAVEHLIDMFSTDDSACEVADAFIDDLYEASELLVLMQSEGGDGPAADAATLLLQLRREMEMKLAA
ncbi:hypothetical protein GQ651_16855 [Alphaproteobacteria bacterium GH1-50]|uniref:50S ribosome-binding GTPase n=1 Tax=Kangsaoukella pontilimi TaxID=2691042 RepID=A0A7C9N2Q9_9RHOB|nr:hypothetical protein [Kangsaoukella pontilimi]MXQ09518.1 hypothetical protein [Kangsaoukella pontilimi]